MMFRSFFAAALGLSFLAACSPSLHESAALKSSGLTFENRYMDSEIARLKPIAEEQFNYESWLSIKERCESSTDLRTLETPVDHFAQDRGTFKYYYEYRKARRENAPLMIYIPGGPGLGSIGSQIFDEFLDDYDVLHVEARGVNCNYLDASFSSYLTTAQHAHDILQIIRAEKPQKYIVYGHSYGTVVATHLAALIDQEAVKKPEAVILEGVLGKKWDGWYEEALEVIEELDKRSGLSAQLHRVNLPLTDVQWGNYLHDAAYDPILIFQMRDKLQELADFPDRQDLRTAIIDEVTNYFEFLVPEAGGQLQTFRAVGCRELMSSFKLQDVAFKDGKLTLSPKDQPDYCNGITLADPYDSAKFQFSSKVIYLQGHFDVQTSLAGARYHYENHKQNAEFIEVPMGGHNPSDHESQFQGCMPDFLAAAVAGKSVLALDLTACAGKIVTSTPPHSAAALRLR